MTDTAVPTWQNLFDPFSSRLIAWPYAQYDHLRNAEPVHWSPPLRAWVLTRMEDVQAVLNDDRFVAVETSQIVADLASRSGRNYDAIVRALSAILFFKDGPSHRKDRRTLSKIMNIIPLTQLEHVIANFASVLTSKLSERSEYDAIAEFADPLPQYVMAHILGVPLADVAVLSELLAELTLTFDLNTLDVYDHLNGKVSIALDLLKSRIEVAIVEKAESPLSLIYGGTSGPIGERLESAAATALFAYRVGAETTIGLIGLLIYTLLQRQDLYRALSDDSSLAPALVSEVLRLESNVQRVVRICQRPRLIGGTTIREGDRVLLLLGAANRDPFAFADPSALNLHRGSVTDVVFGSGHHFCLGASLARMEGRIALEHFVRLPRIELAGDEEWYAARSIRRLTSMPVRVIAPSDEAAK